LEEIFTVKFLVEVLLCSVFCFVIEHFVWYRLYKFLKRKVKK